MAPWLGADLSYVAIDPRVVVVDGSAAFASELHDETPDGRAPAVEVPRAERDRLLGEAEVILVGYPVPRSIVGRAPHLRWAHHTQAGVSNLHRSDLWTSAVTLTSGRGTVAARAIAEYALAAAMFVARGLDEATPPEARRAVHPPRLPDAHDRRFDDGRDRARRDRARGRPHGSGTRNAGGRDPLVDRQPGARRRRCRCRAACRPPPRGRRPERLPRRVLPADRADPGDDRQLRVRRDAGPMPCW